MKNPVLLLLFILGMVGYVITENCPSEEDMSPCSCEEEDDDGIEVLCNKKGTTVDQIKGVLNAISGKRNVILELRELNLGKLPGSLFKGVNIKELELYNCKLEGFTDSDDVPSFSGLEDSLEDLFIIGSIDDDTVTATLRVDHLRRLKELEFAYNKITELPNECCEKVPPALEIYVASNNGIEKLGDRVFRNLNSVKEFSLDGNRFGPIVRSMLPSSPDKLERLELDNNAFESLPEDLFTNMPSLRTVSLSNNHIATLQKATFEAIWEQLDELYLHGNPLKCDSDMKWLSAMRKAPVIHGTCRFPKDKNGMDLQDFIDGKEQ